MSKYVGMKIVALYHLIQHYVTMTKKWKEQKFVKKLFVPLFYTRYILSLHGVHRGPISSISFLLFLLQISHWRFPECSLRDKFLHFFFIVNVCLMIACAAVTIICFKEVEPVREPILNRQPHIDLFFQASVFSGF